METLESNSQLTIFASFIHIHSNTVFIYMIGSVFQDAIFVISWCRCFLRTEKGQCLQNRTPGCWRSWRTSGMNDCREKKDESHDYSN